VWDSEGEVARSLDGAVSPIATSRNKLKGAPGPSMLVRQLSDRYPRERVADSLH